VFAQLMLAYHNYPEKLLQLSHDLFDTAKGYNYDIISKQRNNHQAQGKIQSSSAKGSQRLEGRRGYSNNVERELPQIRRAPPIKQSGERIGKTVEVTDDEVNALLAILANRPPKETPVSDSKVDLSASNLAKKFQTCPENREAISAEANVSEANVKARRAGRSQNKGIET
jgi:hypothetical protein